MARPQDLPDFESPPLGEVSIGVSFNQLDHFKAPHYGLLWSALGIDFPTVQHAAPIGNVIVDPLGIPFPRVLYVHRDDNELVQLQPDRLIFNWRNSGPRPSYPRYEVIREKFVNHFSRWHEIVRTYGLGELKPTGQELSYVNHIPKGFGWNSRADMGKVIRGLSPPSEQRKSLAVLKDTVAVWVFDLPLGGGDLAVTAKFGIRQPDGQELLILELKARKLFETPATEPDWAWFDMARRAIVEGFSEITWPDVQQSIWKRIK